MTTLEPTLPIVTSLPATIRRVILTGFMGAGKTTTGLSLAERLGWKFLDLDRHLEQRAHATIPDLFALHGESHFRRLESSALASALAQTSSVIALGGGTPEFHRNRILLEQTPGTLIIFLDAPFPVLYDRCILQNIARPVLNDPAAAEDRFHSRLPHYRRLAHITQQTTDITAHETVSAILRSIGKQNF